MAAHNGSRSVAMTSLLEIENLQKQFSGVTAVGDVSFSIAAGSITALVGPNGAGKTTCFNLIAGSLQPTSGVVRFAGHAINGLAPEQICRRGIARTFQIVRPLQGMSVIENVMVGAFSRTNDVEDARARAHRVLQRVDFDRKSDQIAHTLTLPDRKMLELCRALATDPQLILLDEVMAGLRPAEAAQIVTVLKSLNQDGLTILLVEHVMRIIMALAGHVIVLHHGSKIAEGDPHHVTQDKVVIDSYLGRKAHG
jgi:branched-chain amino acid transport system ATP-binding protein